MPGTTTSDTVLTPSATGVTPVPGYVGATLVPWPIVPLSSRGDIGYEVFDGAYGGFSIDEDWIGSQSPKIDMWNDTVFKNHKDIYFIDVLGEVEQVITTAGVRG
jgi:hypothetical protein